MLTRSQDIFVQTGPGFKNEKTMVKSGYGMLSASSDTREQKSRRKEGGRPQTSAPGHFFTRFTSRAGLMSLPGRGTRNTNPAPPAPTTALARPACARAPAGGQPPRCARGIHDLAEGQGLAVPSCLRKGRPPAASAIYDEN